MPPRGAVHVQAGPSVPELVAGTIDLIYLTPKGWRIVDYKTDGSVSHETLTRYQAQMNAYEQAWTSVTGMATTGTLAATRLETRSSPSVPLAKSEDPQV